AAPAASRGESVAMTDQVPIPPIPSVPKEALLVSIGQAQASPASIAEKAAQRSAKPASTAPARFIEQPPRAKPSKPATQRTPPGAKFGTGTVTAIHLKEGVAVLEVSSEAVLATSVGAGAAADSALTDALAVDVASPSATDLGPTFN